ncbi:MAG: PEGA domain-containing protein [Candidatus Aminicenantia bacterium]
MQRIKTLKTTKFLAYVLIGVFLFYLNAAEISYSQSPSPEEFVQEGKTLYSVGNYELSIEKLRQAESYLKAVKDRAKAEKLAEIYFYQGLNFAKQGNEKISKAFFKRALHYSPEKEYDTSLMNETTKKIFTKAKLEFEKEFSPKAMGMPADGDGGGGSSAAWIVLGIVVLIGAGVLAYFLLKEKEEEKEKEKEPDVGSIQVNSTPTGATIWLDGSNTGQTTNATLTNVSVGSHTIKLVKERYQDWETTVNVQKNQTSTVNATLKPGSFTENFNDGKADYWKKGEGPATWVVEGGVYKVKQGGRNRQTSYYNFRFSNNWTYEIKGKIAVGRAYHVLGPAFGGNNNFSVFYYLDVSPGNQMWSVWKISNIKTASVIKNWTTNKAINKTGWNKLKVVAQGNTFTFYANNTQLGQVTISGVPSKGKIGLCTWTYSNLDQTHFDNISFNLSATFTSTFRKGEILTPRPASRPDADSGIIK